MLSIDDRRGPERCPEAFNLAQYVLDGSGIADDRIALAVLSLSGAERWSYGRLRSSVKRLAAQMTAAGLVPGDKLMLRLGHSPAYPIAFLSAAWAGILPIPTSPALTLHELNALTRSLAPHAIASDRQVALPDSDVRILDVATLPDAKALSEPETGAADRPGYMLATSGTSGEPRLVIHAHRAIWARRFMQAGWTDMTGADRVLHAGAFNWSYTLGTGLFDPWSLGATALVLDKDTDIAALPLLARRHDATIIAAVPGVYRRMLRGQLPSLPKLRHALSAGEKLPEKVRSQWRNRTGTDIHEAFGQTECSTFISGSPARPAPPASLGYTQPGRAVAVIGDNGPVLRGEIGQIAIHHNDPGLSLSPIPNEGDWVRTGDVGIMEADGAIAYQGRADDILTAGGYRVSPIEIECVFDALPEIGSAAAVDHRLDGETTIIALYYTATAPLVEGLLADHAKHRLAPYKRPRLYIHAHELPVGRNGKLLRRALRAEKDETS